MAPRSVRFGFVRPARVLPDAERWSREAEALGAELFGFGDSQTMWGDPYVSMALTARATKHAKIGSWVTTPGTRHPTVAASSIATVQKLSGGRAFFGIGPGDSAHVNAGLQPWRMAQLADYALAVRALCAGREAHWQGASLQLNWDVEPVPLWLAGDGPRMLELAGRIADGVIVGNAATPALVRFALDHIRRGAESANRRLEDLDVWCMVRLHLAESERQGIEDMKFYLASYANVRFRRSMERKGVEITPELGQRIRAFRREFRGEHAYDPQRSYNLELLDRYDLTDWLASQFLITGRADAIVARLRELVAAGARNFAVPQMLPDLLPTTRALGRDVLSAFRDTR